MDPRDSHETTGTVDSAPRFLTPREVRRRLNVSRDTLLSWAEHGQIEYIRLPSGHRRYSRLDVERLEQGAAS